MTAPRPHRLRADDLVLFLDFDGVLHADAVYRTRHGLDAQTQAELRTKLLQLVSTVVS